MNDTGYETVGGQLVGPRIKFEHVSKVYEKTKVIALDDVSFEVGAGEFAFLMGHSGSGKSSLIKLLMLEQKTTSGKIFVGEQDVTILTKDELPFLRRKMGVVFQDFRLIPSKNVFDNVAFAMEIHGCSRKQIKTKVMDALKVVEIAEKAKSMPNQLSGGEQQRVAIARAIVNRPGFVIADEPTGNLDPENSKKIMSLLKRINNMGATVIVATHEAEYAEHSHERIIRLDHGVKQAEEA